MSTDIVQNQLTYGGILNNSFTKGVVSILDILLIGLNVDYGNSRSLNNSANRLHLLLSPSAYQKK